jgi:hypothetical protein
MELYVDASDVAVVVCVVYELCAVSSMSSMSCVQRLVSGHICSSM